MSSRNGSGKQAVWTTAMSSFVLKFMANLVAGGTRTCNSFKEVHHESCAKALNERFRVHVNAAQISNHLRKWKRIWVKVTKLKNLSGALWDEHTCTIVLDQEHYTGHVKVGLQHIFSHGGGIAVSIYLISRALLGRNTIVMPTS